MRRKVSFRAAYYAALIRLCWLKQSKVLIFDEAVSNLDQQTAELFAQTVNKLKGKVTILFITHQLPKGLQVDEAVVLGKSNKTEVKRTEGTKNEG